MCFSEDYSTDEEYLNTIAGFEGESDDEEEAARKTFNLVDHDGSGQISMDEFLEYTKRLAHNQKLEGTDSVSAKRLEALETKVAENSRQLERICQILEEMRAQSA